MPTNVRRLNGKKDAATIQFEDGKEYEGVVRWYDRRKGYGFLKSDAFPDNDIFAHARHFDVRDPREGDQVTFLVAMSARANKPEAIDIEVLSA